MKNKYIVLLSIVILGFIAVWVFSTNKGADTAIEAIVQSGRNVDELIYQEEVENGTLVFFTRDVGERDTIEAGFIRKALFGWKWVYGGGFSGYSGQYFETVSGTPFPMIFGEVKNQAIEQVKVLDKQDNEIGVSPVAGTDNHRVWFVYLDKSAGPNFNIVYLSADSDVLDTKSFTTSDINF
jgi:hypothetical protein